MSSSDPTHLQGGALQAAISNAVVSTISEFTGRGPTKVRTTLSGDWVFVTLEDSLTKGERKLAEIGREDSVTRTRHDYQVAMARDLSSLIAELTGREVLAFMSANHVDPDYAVEAFALAPAAA